MTDFNESPEDREVCRRAAFDLLGEQRTPTEDEHRMRELLNKMRAADEPDWDECIRQAEVATGLKVERHTLSIVIREVRRWLAGRNAGVSVPIARDLRKRIEDALQTGLGHTWQSARNASFPGGADEYSAQALFDERQQLIRKLVKERARRKEAEHRATGVPAPDTKGGA